MLYIYMLSKVILSRQGFFYVCIIILGTYVLEVCTHVEGAWLSTPTVLSISLVGGSEVYADQPPQAHVQYKSK